MLFGEEFVFFLKKKVALRKRSFFEKVGLIFDPRPSHYDENDHTWIL